MKTVGGGRILRVAERGYKRAAAESIHHIEALAEGASPEALLELIATSGASGISLTSLAKDRRISEERTKEILSGQPVKFLNGKRLVYAPLFDNACRQVLEGLEAFHKSRPTERGMAKTQAEKLAEPSLAEAALAELAAAGRIAVRQGIVRLADFTPEGALSDAQRKLAREIESAFLENGLTTPPVKDVLGPGKDGERILKYLIDEGILVAIHTGARNQNLLNALVFHRDALSNAEHNLLEAFPPPQSFTVPEFKDLLGVSRKYAIPLLEHFDRMGFTKREGDSRTVRS